MTNKTKDTTLFYKLQEKFNLPATEFLRYMSLINSIPKDWKYKLKHEIQIVPIESNFLKQIRNQTHVNKFVYNNFMRYSQGAVRQRSSGMSNFQMKRSNGKIFT